MDRFFNSIGELLRVFSRMAGEELRGLRNSILWLIGFLYLISVFQLIVNNYTASSIFGFIVWVLSIFVIFNIRRIINITGTGEALEILRITPTAHSQQAQQGSAAVVINPLSTIFWGIALQVFFFVTIASLATPLLPLRNNPIFVLLFPSMAVSIAIAFKGTALRVVNWISSVFILILFLVHAFWLFSPNASGTPLGRSFSVFGVSIRSGAQSANTYSIPANTVIYKCSGNSCTPSTLKYDKSVEGISLGEPFNLNGVTYEKFSLPDPKSGQPGAKTGWIPSGKFGSVSASKKETVVLPFPEDYSVLTHAFPSGEWEASNSVKIAENKLTKNGDFGWGAPVLRFRSDGKLRVYRPYPHKTSVTFTRIGD